MGPANAFGPAAGDYEAARPSYPPEAVALLERELGVGPGARVCDLAAGTGKLTRLLASTGADVVAVEPVPGMRDQLLATTPGVEVLDGTAEAIPLPDGSVDVVTVAQAFHWFRFDEALAEIARVLRPGGTLLLEFANLSHALNRLRYAARGRRIPRTPVPVAAAPGRIPFVNHHPKALLALLEGAGFAVEAVLSGSNLRSPLAKRVLGTSALLRLERRLQPALAPLYFGPSIWLRLRKTGH
jgi:SAM-dependent methyltransferase